MKNKTKVIKLLTHKISIKVGLIGKFEEVRYLIHIGIINNLSNCIFINNIETDLLKRLK